MSVDQNVTVGAGSAIYWSALFTFDDSSNGNRLASITLTSSADFALAPRDIDFADVASITFTIGGDSNNFIDELRIGSTYAAVIPEPGTALLLLPGKIRPGQSTG